MENIGFYLGACAKLGQPAYETYQTVDLFEAKDMKQVVLQIHSMGRLMQKKPDYTGPVLGVKEATRNERVFSEAQLIAARGTATFLNQGSSQTPAAVSGMTGHKEIAGTQIARATEVPSHIGLPQGAATLSPSKSTGVAEAAGAAPPPAEGGDPFTDLPPPDDAGDAAAAPPPPPPPPPAVPDVSEAAAPAAPAAPPVEVSDAAPVEPAPPVAARASSAHALAATIATEDADAGRTRDASSSMSSRNEPGLEQEARAWIEAVTGEPLGDGSFHEVLKSGVALCNLVRALQPDIIKAPSKLPAPFKQMENIGFYLGACAKLGQHANDTFQTVDLFEGKDMYAVIRQLHSLGRLMQKKPDYTGPVLGVKESQGYKREFTEAQLMEARATTTFLGKGSAGTAGAAVSRLEQGKVIDRANVAGNEGLGKGGEVTLVGKGAHGTPGAGLATAELLGHQIVKTTDEVAGLGLGGEATLGTIGSAGKASLP
jgi:hypothetical protein